MYSSYSYPFLDYQCFRTKTLTMKAALAILFVCFAGAMASPLQTDMFQQLLLQGQTLVQSVVNTLQGQILTLAQQALGSLTSLVGSFGGRNFVDDLLAPFKPLVNQLSNQLLVQLLGGLSGFLGGSYSYCPVELS